MQAIYFHLFLRYHFPTVALDRFCKCKSNTWLISETFCASPNSFEKVCKNYIISLKEWRVYCNSLLNGRIPVCEEYIECILVFAIEVPKFQKTNSDHVVKWKISHATIVAIFWDNCSKILRQNSPKENEWQTFWENSRLWDQIWPTERIIKILRNRHWIFNWHNISHSCDKFHVIWSIINFGCRFTQTFTQNIWTTQAKNITYFLA